MSEFTFRDDFGIIRRHRQALNLTVEEVAARMGIDKSQITKYETNKSGIPDFRFKQLAKALKVHFVWLSYEFMVAVNPGIELTKIGKKLKANAMAYRNLGSPDRNGHVNGKPKKTNAKLSNKRRASV